MNFNFLSIKKKKTNKNTNGFCPFNIGCSKAGCLWDITQSMISPSGLCRKTTQTQITQTPFIFS